VEAIQSLCSRNGAIPDVYTMPFNSLNFTFSKALGEKQQSSIGFKAENILNNEVESHYQSFKANDQIFSKKHTGTAFSLSYAYKF